MATMLVGGAIVNALAFTGSGYLFKMLDKNGYQTEMKRHDLAQEQLQSASAAWAEHRKQTIDFVNLQIKKENQAAIDFRSADNALLLYNEIHPTNKVEIRKKPQLRDFYTPSKEMKNYEYLWIILGMSGFGLLAYKYSGY